MKKRIIFSNHFAARMILKIKCFFLLMRNRLRNRRLRIKGIFLNDRFVIEGNKINLFWNTEGCHKIAIKNVGLFAGNISGISFTVRDVTNPIEISFYGVSKTVIRKFFVNGAKVNLLDSFDSNLFLPIAIEVFPQRKKLEYVTESSNLLIYLPKIHFKLSAFERKNYQLGRKTKLWKEISTQHPNRLG